VEEFMESFGIHRRIADALAGSFKKAETLQCEQQDENTYRILEANIFNKCSIYLVHIGEPVMCSCRKMETV
jgi:hypothetical protein